MQIKKIYNNNIAMVKNEAGDEVILVGKGIVFGLKKGDEIQAEKAEKKFELKGEAKHKFEKMIQDTPIDYILVSEEIIAYFKEHSTKALNRYLCNTHRSYSEHHRAHTNGNRFRHDDAVKCEVFVQRGI